MVLWREVTCFGLYFNKLVLAAALRVKRRETRTEAERPVRGIFQ